MLFRENDAVSECVFSEMTFAPQYYYIKGFSAMKHTLLDTTSSLAQKLFFSVAFLFDSH